MQSLFHALSTLSDFKIAMAVRRGLAETAKDIQEDDSPSLAKGAAVQGWAPDAGNSSFHFLQWISLPLREISGAAEDKTQNSPRQKIHGNLQLIRGQLGGDDQLGNDTLEHSMSDSIRARFLRVGADIFLIA